MQDTFFFNSESSSRPISDFFYFIWEFFLIDFLSEMKSQKAWEGFWTILKWWFYSLFGCASKAVCQRPKSGKIELQTLPNPGSYTKTKAQTHSNTPKIPNFEPTNWVPPNTKGDIENPFPIRVHSDSVL